MIFWIEKYKNRVNSVEYDISRENYLKRIYIHKPRESYKKMKIDQIKIVRKL